MKNIVEKPLLLVLVPSSHVFLLTLFRSSFFFVKMSVYHRHRKQALFCCFQNECVKQQQKEEYVYVCSQSEIPFNNSRSMDKSLDLQFQQTNKKSQNESRARRGKERNQEIERWNEQLEHSFSVYVDIKVGMRELKKKTERMKDKRFQPARIANVNRLLRQYNKRRLC